MSSLLLQEYSVACTTRIVGLAGEECGRLSYDIDQVFDKNELLDPEFPLTVFSEDTMINPEDILTDICGARLEHIVETIGKMEDCWLQIGYFGSGTFDIGVARKLWDFVKDHAAYHVESLYGEKSMKEFYNIGNQLFN